MNPIRPHSAPARGFTLLEMTVVMAIFILLAGGIYSTVSVAMRATAVLTEDTLQSQRLDAFVSLLRRTFRNLPASARFSGGVRVDDGEGCAEIVLRDAPGVFAWGSGGPSAGTVVLSARPRLGGGREISLLMLPGSLGEMERRDAMDGADWLRLLPDLRGVTWRFYDPSREDWVEEWPEGNERPPLAELTLELLGEEAPQKFVFWLPPVKEVTVAAEPPAAEATPTPEATPEEPQQPEQQ